MSDNGWSEERTVALDLEGASMLLWGMCIGYGEASGRDIRTGDRKEDGALVELRRLDFDRKRASMPITRVTDTVQVVQAWRARIGHLEVWEEAPEWFEGHPDVG